MELITWMWVFDKRYLFAIEYSQAKIILAWLLPFIYTIVSVVYMIAAKKGHDGRLWIAVALGIAKAICIGTLIVRQIRTS